MRRATEGTKLRKANSDLFTKDATKTYIDERIATEVLKRSDIPYSSTEYF